ncbi:hypothetical protein [Halobacillus karajensis]|uniref:hypothetical protein n=1 Tax=Halobacillus karajensis TaxID=195088 RepID=UPI00045C9FBA|nr:hypothetical protein [Halobacillus karajensis]CDQ17934.1 hypothetical protein BN982_00174 [Halobacillus karajensis]
MSEQKEVEDMEKFMTILMDVKVSLAQQNQKLDNVLDMKKKVEQTQVVANEADRVSKQNKKDIKEWEKKMEKKADKDDVERIIKQKDNWHRNLPAWIAVAISVIVFLSQYISI